MLTTGIANLWNKQITHDRPYSYLAGDTFQHWVRTEGIKDAGNYRNRASFQTYGYDDVIGDYPPLLFHLSIIFSNVSGLPTYDAILFLIFLTAILATLIIYFILKDFNKHIAIISLPFSLLIFSGASYTGFTWGHWPSLLAQFYLIAVLWSIKNIDLKKSYLLIAAFFTATILAHTSEAIMGFFFIIFYLAIMFWHKNKPKEKFFTFLKAGILSFILSLWYLIIFKGTWTHNQGYEFSIITSTGGSPSVQFADYGIFAFIIIIGFILSLLLLKQKKNQLPIISSIFFLIMGYTNYIGFHSRAFQIRYFWPIYLCFFIGLIFYTIPKKFLKWNIMYSYIIAFVLLALFANLGNVSASIPNVPFYEKLSSPGMMDPYHWEAYSWMHENSPKDAKVLFLYGDQFSQTNYLLSVKRVPYKVDPQDFFTTLQNPQPEREFIINIYGDNVNSYPYWKSFLSFGYYLDETTEFEHGLKHDICNFDYYIYDKASFINQEFPIFNNAITTIFKNHGMKELFANQLVGIIFNPKPGEDCVG